MKLHEDRYAFLTIIGIIHEASGIRSDVLEKDYYVSMLLKELAEKQLSLPAYFKGGTALYKAQKSIRRFSEDIDLTVCIDGCSNSQAKKRLEAATKKYRSLPRTVRKELEDDRKGSITAVYDYVPIVTVDMADPLQRFGFVKVEGTSFTVSEPFSELEVEPVIYTLASRGQREILKEQYGVEPFTINTIRMERIFADKIFAAEFYYERAMYFDAAKHIYDVSVMTGLDSIKELLQNYMEFQRMLNYKRLEETHRTGSDLSGKKYDDFGIFAGIEKNNELKDAFGVMQDNYVFTDDDILPFDYVVHEWQELKKVLLTLDS
ncbi:MAG TPA: nucleotidyl transferase AbiEii/AbiGii toxin family protein [Candidatus Avanaerovorax faecigallinarum]|nr:nucleotidyl transferase AbiEii/AbiGii toxin family protein [Candidatus Avanaerovorax faecigallinarum]